MILMISSWAHAAQLDLTEAENGKDIVLGKRDALVVRLPANPSTGYSWQPSFSKPDIFKALGSGTYETAKTGNKVGVPMTVAWKLKAVKSGSLRITFTYIRPWEKNVPPAREVSWPVTIRP